MEKGIGIVVASYNARPDCIKSAMEILVPEYVGRITIVTCSDNNIKASHDKTPSLNYVVNDVYGIEDKNKVVLVDDDLLNIGSVIQGG